MPSLASRIARLKSETVWLREIQFSNSQLESIRLPSTYGMGRAAARDVRARPAAADNAAKEGILEGCCFR